MFMILLLIAVLAAGVVIGAYSHKWLAKVTGAPSNLSAATAPAAIGAVVAHGVDAAHAAIDAVAAVAKASVSKS